MVALFFLSVALGTAIAGWLAEFYTPRTRCRTSGCSAASRSLLGLALLAAAKPVLKMMRGVR